MDPAGWWIVTIGARSISLLQHCALGLRTVLIQFSSRWYICARKSPYALNRVSQKFPQCRLRNGSNVETMQLRTFQKCSVQTNCDHEHGGCTLNKFKHEGYFPFITDNDPVSHYNSGGIYASRCIYCSVIYCTYLKLYKTHYFTAFILV